MIQRVLLTLTFLLFADVASASIALYTDGRSSKITAYSVEDQVIHLTLTSGGVISVPLSRIDRIVDDEVVTPEVVAEVKKIEEDGVFPKRSWRYQETRAPLFKSRFNEIIVKAARHFDVDAALVSAVIKAESDYNPKTVSHKGARGLMQLMPATAKRFGVTDSFDPTANIYAGTRYLRWLLNTFEGNADLAVAAYNAGEGNVWKYKGVPPFRETVTYIRRIASHLHKIEPGAVSAVAASR
ncbi:MAG TPA: lytic transglycosylase domain-containing protein [Thermoanaerobaculia bacterium]|nr:lytic transglycosylase domain-containing protein [Thermoanaerobaculia bacterium]